MSISPQTQKKLKEFFLQIADLELQVEDYRQRLAMLYDFEPYAAFKRIDQDDDDAIYTMDFYNYLRENGVT